MTGQWLISLRLVPAVCQASGYRSYKDVTGFLAALLRDCWLSCNCHKRLDSESQRMKTTQQGDVNLSIP